MLSAEAHIIENLFTIINKDGEEVPFKLNKAQRDIDKSLTGRDLYPKARQRGVSTYFLARNLVRCLSVKNTSAVVISHESEATQRMLGRVRYWIETMKGPKPIVDNYSKNEITFPKMNSRFYIGTAGSRKFGRGDTITDLHASEIAFWPDAEDLARGLFQAVPRKGNISIESTGNGKGNYYHRMCMNAGNVDKLYENQRMFVTHFLPWYEEEEYCVPLSLEEELKILGSLREDLEEPMIMKRFNLSAGQIAWRREKLQEFDWDLRSFKQEYPSTLDECFQATGHSIFPFVNYIPTERWQKVSRELHVLEDHPIPGHRYIIGADISAGVYRDDTVIEVVDLETFEQCGELVTDSTAPDIAATKIRDLGEYFNKAYAGVESNNHGLTTLNELRKIYPLERIYADREVTRQSSIVKFGVATTAKTKPLHIGYLRQLLVDTLLIHSPFLKDQLDTFIEKEDGKLEAENCCKDDAVMAMSIIAAILNRAAYMIAPRQEYIPKEQNNPFALETIIEEFRGRRSRYPIAPQTGDSYEDFATFR